MTKIKCLLLTAAAALILSACGAPAGNAPANAANSTNAANANAAKPAAAAPTKESIMALEKSLWEGWKNRDAKPFEEVLSDKYVGFGSTGRLDKATSIKNMTAQNCKVNSYSWSDEQMRMLGADVAVLTYKAEQDYTCDGKKGDTPTWSAGVYLREGDKWKNVFYAETKVTDPKAPPPPARTGEAKAAESKPDAFTETLMAVEKRGWDGWVARDAKALGDVTASEFTYFSGRGRADRAEAMKLWTEPKCEGLAYTFAEPMGVQLSKDAALVTYKADVKGKCDGTPVAPTVWVASFDIKEGDAWKNSFYMDFPR
jgi:hypothetical protein